MSESLFEQYKAALRRGHMAALAGELDDALAAYEVAARLVPERALPLASRGSVLHRLDRWPEAAEAFDRALQLAPDDEASLRARGTARAERGLTPGAAADFERLAFVLDVAGRAPLAAEAAARAMELEPNPAREALAIRLRGAADQLAEPAPPADLSTDLIPEPAVEAAEGASPGDDEGLPEDPWSAALDARRIEALDAEDTEFAAADAVAEPAEPADDAPAATPVRFSPATGPATYDALDALRAGMDAEEAAEKNVEVDAPALGADQDAAPPAGAEPAPESDAPPHVAAVDGTEDGAEAGGTWPGIDLPSPPPPPIEGTPPEPEDLVAEAALVLESGEIEAARDLLLTAARVHRDAGRIDAALEICLNLLTIAPGDPRVHLAIANLQLDRGWTGVATEKIDLLVRLTSLTGDTQAEADVHGLASERLRDDPVPTPAGRRG